MGFPEFYRRCRRHAKPFKGINHVRINPLIPKNDKQDMIDAFEWLCMSPTSSVKFWKTHKKRDKHPVSSSSRRRAPLCLRVSQLHQQAMFVVILLPEAPTRLTGRPLGLRMEKG
jgi:hypothetical protein